MYCILPRTKGCIKKKSAKPNILLARLDSRVSAYLDKEIHFIPSFLNKGNYFWEKFVLVSLLIQK